ncbi:MAG: type II secretion system F family protein [Clostridia bacterium]|nr:type II secretion system F family protein [Clostridia bacterium]MBN2883665.1 type II secretion system F family protein [Clostridia bacterium]
MAFIKKTLQKEEIALFARQLSLVADSDVPMQQGLAIISERNRNPKINVICQDVTDRLNQGVSFHEAIRLHEAVLGKLFVEMVQAGELSGNLPIMLERTAASIEKQMETSRKIRSAVSYPLILGTLMLAVIVLMLFYVLPMFNDILTSLGGDMNPMTRGLMNFGLFVSNNFIWIIIVIAVIAAAIMLMRVTDRGRKYVDFLKLHFPWFRKINRSDIAAVFARNLAMLIKSGINITIAIGMLRGIIGNSIISEKLRQTEDDLSHGERIETALGKLKLFPELLIKLFSVAMETGGLDRTLEKAAEIMEKETDDKLERMTSVLEPLMIIVLSLLVGFILISVILPVTGILNSIG